MDIEESVGKQGTEESDEEALEHNWFPKPLRGREAVRCLACGYTALTTKEMEDADEGGCWPGS